MQIAITASGVSISPMIVDYIENNAYIFDNIVDHDGDNICFQSVFGIETEYELEKMLFSMVPEGIYTSQPNNRKLGRWEIN